MSNNGFGIKDYNNMRKKYGIKLPFLYFYENHLFDLLNNVDTHKRVFKRSDNISKNFDDGVFYMASFNSVIKKTLKQIYEFEQDEFKNFQLIDIGSGKGKVLIVWKKFLNKRNLNNKLFGIEYDMTLTDIAIKNLKKKKYTDIEFYNNDFEDVPEEIFNSESIYYLYNPFGEKTIEIFLKKLSGKNYIIYNNPIHLETFQNNNYEILIENYGFHPNLNWVILKKTNI